MGWKELDTCKVEVWERDCPYVIYSSKLGHHTIIAVINDSNSLHALCNLSTALLTLCTSTCHLCQCPYLARILFIRFTMHIQRRDSYWTDISHHRQQIDNPSYSIFIHSLPSSMLALSASSLSCFDSWNTYTGVQLDPSNVNHVFWLRESIRWEMVFKCFQLVIGVCIIDALNCYIDPIIAILDIYKVNWIRCFLCLLHLG